MRTYMISALTAHGDTTKTKIDGLKLPNDCRAIVGVACYADAAATLTSAEPVTGILELESNDMNIVPCQIPLHRVNILTSGAVSGNVVPYPVMIPTKGGETVNGYVTMDLAQTGAQKARFILEIEVARNPV